MFDGRFSCDLPRRYSLCSGSRQHHREFVKIVKRGVSTRRVVFMVAVRDVGRVSRLPMTRGSSQAPFPISIAFDFIRSYQQSHPASSASIRCRRFNVCDRGSRNGIRHDQLFYQYIERIHSIDVIRCSLSALLPVFSEDALPVFPIGFQLVHRMSILYNVSSYC